MRLGQVLAVAVGATFVVGQLGASVDLAWGVGGVIALIGTGVFLSHGPRSDQELALTATMWVTIAALVAGRLLAPGLSYVAFVAVFVCFVGVSYTASLALVRKTRAPADPGP